MGQIGLLLHVSHLYDEKTLTLKLWIWGVLSHSTNAENPMCVGPSVRNAIENALL